MIDYVSTSEDCPECRGSGHLVVDFEWNEWTRANDVQMAVRCHFCDGAGIVTVVEG